MSDPTLTRAPGRRGALSRGFAKRWPFDPRKAAVGIVAWLIALVVLSTVVDQYFQGVLASIGLNALLALGLILVTGLAGQFSLAQAAFYGMGAYGSAILTVSFGWPAWAALIFCAALTMSVALALGPPIFRLRGHFLAMGTLALTEIFFLIVTNLPVTGGASGFGGVENFDLFGFVFATPGSQLWLVWVVVGVALWGCLRISAGREGRALRAIRGHEAAAESLGINITWSKSRVLAGSALIGSVGGSIYAHQILYVNPAPFTVTTSIDVLAIVVLGGLGSPWGAIIGAFVFELIRQGVDALLPTLFGQGAVGAGEGLAFGVILIVVLIVRPDGLVGLFTGVSYWVRRRREARGAPPTATGSAAPADGGVEAAREPLADEAPPFHTVGAEVVLRCSALTKTFGGVHALQDVDLELYAHEILAVIGPNGAGKSTLQNLLSGNLVPTSGTIELDGETITGQKAHRIAAKGLARTFQTPSLFAGMSTHDNALTGAYLRGRAGLWRSSLPTVGAVREDNRLGDEVELILDEVGLGDLVGRNADELSLGQQKTVELARALARQPRILLLDEPGAGLNRSEKVALAAILRRLRAGGLSMIVIEHDMEFVMSLADRIQVLEFGRTLMVGTPAEVQADPRVVAAYLGVETTDLREEVEDV